MLGVGYFLVVSSQYTKLENTTLKEEELKQAYSQLSFREKRLSAEDQSTKFLSNKYKHILESIPPQKEVPKNIKQITAIANELNIKITKLKRLKSTNEEYYSKIPIEFEARGTYHKLAKFIDRVINIKNLVTFNEIILINPVSNEPSPQEPILKLNTIMEIYYQTPKEQAETKSLSR